MPSTEGQLESAFVRSALEALRALPGPSLWWKNHGDAYVDAGRPDIMGVYLGNFFCIECKRPGKYKVVTDGATVAQVRFLRDATRAGAFCMVADDLQAILTLVRSVPARH